MFTRIHRLAAAAAAVVAPRRRHRPARPRAIARLRQGQGRRRLRVLCRRTDRALGGEGAHLRAALSRHQDVDHRRLQQRARQEDRSADQGRQARGRRRDLPDLAGLRALEGGRPAAELQAGRLRRHRRELQGQRRRVLRHDGDRHAVHGQHRRRSARPTCRTPRSISSSRSSAASWSRPIRPTTTPRSGCSTTSCRSTAGTTWTSTWPTSRTSSRAISASSAASPRARTGSPSTRSSTSPSR